MYKYNGKTFYNRKRQHIIQQYYTDAPAAEDKDEQSSESSGFQDSHDISEPSSPIQFEQCPSPLDSPSDQLSHVHAPEHSSEHAPEIPVNSQPFQVQQNLGRSEFSRSAVALPNKEIKDNPNPPSLDADYRHQYIGDPRIIVPRGYPLVRYLRKSPINKVITHLLTTVPQEYTVLPDDQRYTKCINYFSKLLKQGNNDPKCLPRTIIYTSNPREVISLYFYLKDKCKVPADYSIGYQSDEEIKDKFDKCFTKETPILVFESRTFDKGVDNVDLVINYTVPKTIEEYGRRLGCLIHKKCITYVSSDEDRQFLRGVLDIVEESHQKPPQSLKALFDFDANNLERYIREYKPVKSWIDLIDED